MASPGTAGQQPPPLSDAAAVEQHKRAAARAAAELVAPGMRVGLGSGSTVAHLLTALGERAVAEVVYVATSPHTEQVARELGLTVGTLDEVVELDLAIDGADQVDPRGWLVKGGGGAHTREKIVEAAARRFVVIVSADKEVERLAAPVPLELLRFGLPSTLAAIGQARLRAPDRRVGPGTPDPDMGGQELVATPDGGVLAEYVGPVEDPRALCARLEAVPGLVDHGLFPAEMVSEILVAGTEGVRRRPGAKR